MDAALLKYPFKSHRKIINIPQESLELAEFLGIEFGDGGIGNLWQVVISLNSIKDREYADYVSELGSRLFGIKPAIRKRPGRNVLVIVFTSTAVVDFLVDKGAVRGDKIAQEIDIPNWIRKNSEYEKALVRGLVDTDGCLYIHKHTIAGTLYKNIGFCFCSFSERLIISVAAILEKNGIKPYITNKGRDIYLYSAQSVIKYLNTFGSSNPRIINKYEEWWDAGAV